MLSNFGQHFALAVCGVSNVSNVGLALIRGKSSTEGGFEFSAVGNGHVFVF